MKTRQGILFQSVFSAALSIIFSFASSAQGNYQVIVLGTSQDGGYPQLNCGKNCCQSVWSGDNAAHFVASIAVVDINRGEFYLVDCTPYFSEQMQLLRSHFGGKDLELKGIFLTHAHIGHYLGLAQLGKEVIAAREVPVYAMPRMKAFLEGNGPWKQLAGQKNIDIRPLTAGLAISFGDLKFTALTVPHRDEFSETVGFDISSAEASLLYLPDIDAWAKWDRNITKEAVRFDFLLLDGTFYDAGELGGRNMEEVPHPSVAATMELFSQSDAKTRNKIYFTHLNHSNPLHFESSETYNTVNGKGFNVARQGQVISLQKP